MGSRVSVWKQYTMDESQNNVIFSHDNASISKKDAIYCHYNKNKKYFKNAEPKNSMCPHMRNLNQHVPGQCRKELLGACGQKVLPKSLVLGGHMRNFI